MFRFAPVLLICAILFSLGSARGADGWAQLKTGMTQLETWTALGPPLMRTSGRGYVLWFYDCRAEVLFLNGPVIAWTVPLPNREAAARPISKDVTILPGAPLVRRTAVPYRGNEGGFDPWANTQFRYRQRR